VTDLGHLVTNFLVTINDFSSSVMKFFVQNYPRELPSDFAMFQASSVIFKSWLN